jgi:hypothetical protein
MRSPNDASAAITDWLSAGSASRSIRSPMSERFLSAPTAVMAAFATSTSSSSTSSRNSRSKASGRIDSRRAASRRVRRPEAPFSSAIFDSSSFAASRFCDRPGRARNATTAAWIEKSSKSPSASIRSSGSMGSNSVRYNSASVRTPRSGSFTSAST